MVGAVFFFRCKMECVSLKKFAFYRPAIACFILMMVTALQNTALSFFVIPASESLGVGRGSFTIYYSLLAMFGAITAPFLGRFVGKHGVRSILIFSGIWTCIGFFGFSYCNHLWSFYLIAVLIGGTSAVAVGLAANSILQQTYDSAYVSKLLGIVMAGSGVGGIGISVCLPNLLLNWGWRAGYRLIGIVWLALCILAVLLLGRTKTTAGQTETTEENRFGMTREQALHSPRLYASIIEIFILAISCGVLQHMPSLLGAVGIESTRVGTLMSLMTAALALGKIAQSFLYSKIGVQRGGVVTILMFIASMLLFACTKMVYPALIGAAIGLGTYTTLMPLLTRQVFGNYDFPAIWGILQAAGSVGAFLGAPSWGLVYDLSGSYLIALLGTSGLLLVGIAIHLYVASTKKLSNKQCILSE